VSVSSPVRCRGLGVKRSRVQICLIEILPYLRGPLGVGGSKQPPNLRQGRHCATPAVLAIARVVPADQALVHGESPLLLADPPTGITTGLAVR
jgi:hypothetical protein